MEKKFTQGQWRYGYGDGLTGPTTPAQNPTVTRKRRYIPVSVRNETIAIVILPESSSIEELDSNTRLIAAAPELLEACERALQVLEEENIFGQARLLLSVAIRKAIG